MSAVRLGYERHRELHGALHLLLQQRGDPLRLGLRALCDELVVHLQKQPGLQALGAQAAADIIKLAMVNVGGGR